MKLDASVSAIVTGGASGLGAATARMLAAPGVRVALLDHNAERGEAVAAEIGGTFCKADVTDESSIDKALEAARAANGPERILVNCAGIAFGRRTVSRDRNSGAFRAHDTASFRQVVEINLIGTYTMIARCAPAMAALDPVNDDGARGVIVSTSSVAGTEGQIGQAAYAASKAGVMGLTLPVARDLAEYGIRVLAIQPGVFHTPMFDTLDERFQESLAAGIPFPSRLGRAEEYAALVRYFCESDYINGETVRLDGGVRLPPR